MLEAWLLSKSFLGFFREGALDYTPSGAASLSQKHKLWLMPMQ